MKSSTLPTFVSSDFFLNKPNKPIVILMIILFTNYYLNEWKVCPLTPTWQFVCKGTKTVGFHQHSKSFSMSGIISFCWASCTLLAEPSKYPVFLWLFVLNSEVKLMIFEYRFHNIITDKFGQQMFGGPAGKSRSAAVAVE